MHITYNNKKELGWEKLFWLNRYKQSLVRYTENNLLLDKLYISASELIGIRFRLNLYVEKNKFFFSKFLEREKKKIENLIDFYTEEIYDKVEKMNKEQLEMDEAAEMIENNKVVTDNLKKEKLKIKQKVNEVPEIVQEPEDPREVFKLKLHLLRAQQSAYLTIKEYLKYVKEKNKPKDKLGEVKEKKQRKK